MASLKEMKLSSDFEMISLRILLCSSNSYRSMFAKPKSSMKVKSSCEKMMSPLSSALDYIKSDLVLLIVEAISDKKLMSLLAVLGS